MLLVLFSCLWVAGVYLGSLLRLPAALGLLALLPAPLFFYGRRYARPAAIACLGTAVFFGAAVYSYAGLHSFDAGDVSYYNDSGLVRLRGMVADDPDIRDVSTRLNIAAEAIDTGSGWRSVSGRVLVLVPRYPGYRYGDVIETAGPLETPPRRDDFDYRGYLAHQGIYATMDYPGIEVLETGRGLAPLAWIYDLRARLAASLAEVLPEPQASLAQGIVVGVRGNIPADLNSDFSRSGTAHILAISGQNLAIMAAVILGIGLWLFGRRRRLYVWLALGTIWLYTVITGLAPPVVRGAIMVSLFLLAEALGRQRSAIVALTAAAAVMVGVSPHLLGDASFQMSFLAMAGLVFVFPFLREAGRRAVVGRLGEEGAAAAVANFAVDSLSVTLAAIIAVWPVVAYYFGLVSLVGPLATFLALPALPGIVLVGGLAAVAGLASLAIAQVIGWVAWPFLTYLILVRARSGDAGGVVGQYQPARPGFHLGLLPGAVGGCLAGQPPSPAAPVDRGRRTDEAEVLGGVVAIARCHLAHPAPARGGGADILHGGHSPRGQGESQLPGRRRGGRRADTEGEPAGARRWRAEPAGDYPRAEPPDAVLGQDHRRCGANASSPGPPGGAVGGAAALSGGAGFLSGRGLRLAGVRRVEAAH